MVYLESRHRRFELAHTGSKKGADGQAFDKYSLSQVLRPHSMDHPNPSPHPHPNQRNSLYHGAIVLAHSLMSAGTPAHPEP